MQVLDRLNDLVRNDLVRNVKVFRYIHPNESNTLRKINLSYIWGE